MRERSATIVAERTAAAWWLRRPALSLALLVVLLNLNSIRAFFVGDDFDYLRWFQRKGLGRAITLQFWGEWEPAWYLTWFFDQTLWRTNPVGFHLQNVVWLVLLVLALFHLVRELRPASPLAAWAAALLFATNPLHDEAVVYLAARGHLMCAAFSVAALWLYVRSRRHAGAGRSRWRLLLAAWTATALAILSKEIALLLPLWVAALEWGVLTGGGRRLRRTVLGAAGFVLPAAATVALRAAVVGLGSDKLAGATDGPGEMFAALARDLPGYALLGALPLPFALLDGTFLERFRWLGLAALAAAALAGAAAVVRQSRRGGEPHPGSGFYLFALTVASTSLFPVFWADLDLRRRYLFVPSVGIALVAALVLERLGPRLAPLVLGVLVVAGSAATLHRNDLYRRAGVVARNMIEAIRQAPIGQPLAPRPRGRAVLVSLPDRYGGDSVSGAYLFHRTDFVSALTVFGVAQQSIDYALRPDHGQDHTAEVTGRGAAGLDVRVSFRSRRAFDDARRNDPASNPHGKLVRATRIDVDPQARTMTFRLTVDPEFRRSASVLYLYTDGTLVPILPEPAARP